MFENFCPPQGYDCIYMPQGGGKPAGAASRIILMETGDTLRFSMFLCPKCPVSEARALPLAAALCARNAIGSGEIHWPGKIILTGRPACCITSHRDDSGITVEFSIDMVILRACEGVQAEPVALVRDITYALAEAASRCPEELPSLIQAYCAHCVTLMKFVNIIYRGMPVYGFAFALDKHGGLMVMTQETRTVVTVYSGEAEIASSEPEAPELPIMPRI